MLSKLVPLWQENETKLSNLNLVCPEYDSFIRGMISAFRGADSSKVQLHFLPYHTHKVTLSFPQYEFTFCTKNVTNPLFFLNSRFLKVRDVWDVDKEFFWEAPYIATAETKKQFVELMSWYLWNRMKKQYLLAWDESSDSFFLTTEKRFSYTVTTRKILEDITYC